MIRDLPSPKDFFDVGLELFDFAWIQSRNFGQIYPTPNTSELIAQKFPTSIGPPLSAV